MKQINKTVFMARIGKLAIVACVLMAATIITACADNDAGKSVVSGTVTYQEKPIEQGQIRFIPSPGSNLPMAAALIVDGKYQLDRNGGVPHGTYKVSIEAYRVPAKYAHLVKPDKPTGVEIPHEQYLPKMFNRATVLKITIDADSSSVGKDFNLSN